MKLLFIPTVLLALLGLVGCGDDTPPDAPPTESSEPGVGEQVANAAKPNAVSPSSPEVPQVPETSVPREAEPGNEEPVSVGVPTETVRREPPAPGSRNSVGMVMQLVEPGHYLRDTNSPGRNFRFWFGRDNASYPTHQDERPWHPVMITKPFLMARHEVTVGQFRQFVEATNHRTTAERSGEGIVGMHGEADEQKRIYNPFGQRAEFTWKSPGFEQGDDHPVTGVSWEDAQAYCTWLSRKEGVKYRLPTEAEWEYACRAGTQTYFSWGDEYGDRFHRHANLADGSMEAVHPKFASIQWILPDNRDGAAWTSRVGSYEPNGFGLHDMHGNVWEWCEDMYHDTYYTHFDIRKDPLAAAVDPLNENESSYEGDFRVIRGGAFSVAPIQARSAVRGFFERTDAACYLGFRVVCEAPANLVAAAAEVRRKQVAAEEAFKDPKESQIKWEGAWYQKFGDLTLYTRRLPSPELVAYLPYLPRMTYLSVHCEGKATPELVEAVSKMSHLRRLALSYPGTNLAAEHYAPLSELPNLVDLQLHGVGNLTVEQVKNSRSAKTLKVLRFGNPSITDEQLLALAETQFPELLRLDISECGSDGTGLRAFAGSKLQQLSLARLSDAGAAEVAKFPELTHLQVRTPEITRTGLQHLTTLSQLERLDLRNLKQLKDGDFAGIETMSGLRSLQLDGSGAGDETAKRLAGLRLGSLNIGSPSFTDEGLKHVGSISTLFSSLRIGGESRVTDAGLQYLWAPSRLQELSLAQPNGITGSGFEAVSELTQLRTVNVSSEDFTDTGTRFLGYLPNLSNVTLGSYNKGPKGVTDAGLLMLAEAPKLRRLRLHRTNCKVTDEGIARLKEKCPQLEVELSR